MYECMLCQDAVVINLIYDVILIGGQGGYRSDRPGIQFVT